MKNTIILRVGLVAAVGFLNACGEQSNSGGSETSEQLKGADASQYSAEVKRTSYGIPHITAADYASLGYGEGYVAAEDHVCNIAEAVTEVRGEMAKYHGPGKIIKTS
ncbi:MAG: penicillin acylase family protein [Kordiimonadaceae bacterium]|nr:penicillin acylase family protein [Kordiimonadaceae bacterium]